MVKLFTEEELLKFEEKKATFIIFFSLGVNHIRISWQLNFVLCLMQKHTYGYNQLRKNKEFRHKKFCKNQFSFNCEMHLDEMNYVGIAIGLVEK